MLYFYIEKEIRKNKLQNIFYKSIEMRVEQLKINVYCKNSLN